MEPLCLLLSKNLSLELTAAVWSSTTYCVAPLLLRAGLHARAVALALGRSFKLRAVAGVLAVPLSWPLRNRISLVGERPASFCFLLGWGTAVSHQAYAKMQRFSRTKQAARLRIHAPTPRPQPGQGSALAEDRATAGAIICVNQCLPVSNFLFNQNDKWLGTPLICVNLQNLR